MHEQRSWRVPRRKDRALELDRLLTELDQSQSGARGVILLEADRGSLAEALRLIGELGRRWKSRGKGLLLVDAHPARPFLQGKEAPAEGFSEMLRYGLSPESLRAERADLGVDFIGAGTLGDLPLEDAVEPARSLRRLAGAADRVILLADSRDQEGMLGALIEASAFRLRLSDPELDEHLARLAARRSSSRTRLLLMLGIPLLVVLVYLFLPEEPGEKGLRLNTPPARPPRALPESSDLPYFGGGSDERMAGGDSVFGETETLQVPAELEVVHLDPAESAAPEKADAEGPVIESPVVENPPVETGKVAPRALQRRAESRADWKSALDHQGSFHVHVSSFRDSVRALLAQEREGYRDLPFRLQPALVDGRIWYRVHVGRFPELSSAVAFRDSLLDQAGKDFCVIGIDPEP